MIKSVTDKLAQIRRDSEERIAKSKAEKLGEKYINPVKISISIEALEVLSEEAAKWAKLAVIEKKNQKIAVVAIDPSMPETEKAIKNLEAKGYEVGVFVVSLSGLRYVLDMYKYIGKEKEKITGKIQVEEKTKEVELNLNTILGLKEFLEKQELTGGNVGTIFEYILKSALDNRTSDIHLESTEDGANLRFRIDGSLNDVFSFSKEFYKFLIGRIKLLANLKLNITSEAQDGRFTIGFSNKNVEVRVAVAPAQFGEVAVMRLLDPDAVKADLKALGIRDDDLEIIKAELKRPNGMVLNTGPTGSGKTTTLYAFLQYKKSSEIKIITIEDPIEYMLSGMEQTQVDNESGYTFANGLKSLMRQDPDVILVGEIRDKETAEIAIQAALTGHLVFSTVHANSASGAIPRLLDLNVKPASLGPALNLIIGQRLVRRVCSECSIQTTVGDDMKNKINKFINNLPPRVNKENYKDIKIFETKGCAFCNNTGFKGRSAIYELLSITSEMENLILEQKGESEFFKYAKTKQMTTMQEDGILKVISGITTFEEVEEVTGVINWA